MSSFDVYYYSDDFCKSAVPQREWIALQNAMYQFDRHGKRVYEYGSYLGCDDISQVLTMDGKQYKTLDYDTCDL